jgi:beta-phosphoglucomutase family hydrolase
MNCSNNRLGVLPDTGVKKPRRAYEQSTMTTKLGLPESVRACLFDLDGVITETAKVHAAAWKQMFDEFLQARAKATGEKLVPFDAVADYDEYVDGKPRADGTRSFLQSRHIELPEGNPDDPPSRDTIAGLSARKNQLVLALIAKNGVEVYPGSLRYLKAVRAAGLKTAVVSSSANCKEVLAAAGVTDYFDTRIDGVVAAERHLAGKPAPDTYLAAAKALGVGANEAAVFEDALAGVESGKAGHFAYVVGVDRVGQAAALEQHGASVVVKDLAELLERA